MISGRHFKIKHQELSIGTIWNIAQFTHQDEKSVKSYESNFFNKLTQSKSEEEKIMNKNLTQTT